MDPHDLDKVVEQNKNMKDVEEHKNMKDDDDEDKPRNVERLDVLLSPTKQSYESYKVELKWSTIDLLKKSKSNLDVALKIKNPMVSADETSTMTRLSYQTFEPVIRRSVLSFRESVDTFEISNNSEVSSDLSIKYVNEMESVISMVAYADDIAMKEESKLSKSKKSESSNANEVWAKIIKTTQFNNYGKLWYNNYEIAV